MIERPILFSGPLVRAILAGAKTQTRRLVRRPKHPRALVSGAEGHAFDTTMALFARQGFVPASAPFAEAVRSPYGVAGDRLWVRETWRSVGWRPENGHWIEYAADGAKVWREAPSDTLSVDVVDHAHPERWRPSIFLFHWASRITLAVESVRVERLHDISEEDARAEGLPLNTVNPATWRPEDGWLTPDGLANAERGRDCNDDGTINGRPAYVFSAREALAIWWNHINGKRARWESNPWVWAVSFRKVA